MRCSFELKIQIKTRKKTRMNIHLYLQNKTDDGQMDIFGLENIHV